jgi:hypothetical protein
LYQIALQGTLRNVSKWEKKNRKERGPEKLKEMDRIE